MVVLTFIDADDHRIAAHMPLHKFRMLLLDPEKTKGLARSLSTADEWDPKELSEWLANENA